MNRDLAGSALLAGSYLLGSVPFGLLLGKRVAGVDVRQAGSGNIGATNVARTAGKKLGIVTLLLDGAKGALAVAATALAMGERLDGPWAAAAGLAAFLGHVFPPWLRFRGGKGVATAFGVFLVIAPAIAAIAVAVFAAVVAATRVPALGSLAASAMLSALFIGRGEIPYTVLACATTTPLVYTHRSNWMKLLTRSE